MGHGLNQFTFLEAVEEKGRTQASEVFKSGTRLTPHRHPAIYCCPRILCHNSIGFENQGTEYGMKDKMQIVVGGQCHEIVNRLS